MGRGRGGWGLGRGYWGFGAGFGYWPGWGRGNPYPFCRFFPWLPRWWWAMGLSPYAAAPSWSYAAPYWAYATPYPGAYWPYASPPQATYAPPAAAVP